MPCNLFYVGDRVAMRHAGTYKRGVVTNVFEARYLEATKYRVLFDDGAVQEAAIPFFMDPETPLEMLARAGEEKQE